MMMGYNPIRPENHRLADDRIPLGGRTTDIGPDRAAGAGRRRFTLADAVYIG